MNTTQIKCTINKNKKKTIEEEVNLDAPPLSNELVDAIVTSPPTSPINSGKSVRVNKKGQEYDGPLNLINMFQTLFSGAYDGTNLKHHIEELIDNSLDANSKYIRIYIKDDKFHVMDDGVGMDNNRLLKSTQLFSSTNDNSKSIGKFGFGLLKAVISIMDFISKYKKINNKKTPKNIIEEIKKKMNLDIITIFNDEYKKVSINFNEINCLADYNRQRTNIITDDDVKNEWDIHSSKKEGTLISIDIGDNYKNEFNIINNVFIFGLSNTYRNYSEDGIKIIINNQEIKTYPKPQTKIYTKYEITSYVAITHENKKGIRSPRKIHTIQITNLTNKYESN